MKDFTDFLEKHFNELLLSWLLVLAGSLVLYLVHKNCEGKALDWAMAAFGSILSGLLIAIRVGGGGPTAGSSPQQISK